MLVTMRVPAAAQGRSTASMRALSNGSKPALGSRCFWTCASAIVRSARHSKPRYRMSPCSASSTAGSMRSPEYPAPDPMRTVFIGALRSNRDDAEGDGGEGHQHRGAEQEGDAEALMRAELDAGQAYNQEGRRRQRADREPGGHLPEQRGLGDLDRLAA